MKPKVTLLRGSKYTVVHGVGAFTFSQGVPMEVPVPVALWVQKLNSQQPGKVPLFRIADMPKIVTPPPPGLRPLQNGHGSTSEKIYQTRFKGWA